MTAKKQIKAKRSKKQSYKRKLKNRVSFEGFASLYMCQHNNRVSAVKETFAAYELGFGLR
jgi:protein-disulfide isomerase-like protein with CxxC motif